MLRAPRRAVKRNAHAILGFGGGLFLFKWRRLLFVVHEFFCGAPSAACVT